MRLKADDLKLLIAFLLIFAITQVPIYVVDYPNIQDLPNHIARLYVQLELPRSAVLQRFYEVNWALSPNLAMDVLGEMLGPLLGPILAVKVMLSMASLLMASGALMLNRVLVGHSNPWAALLPLLLLQNIFVSLGFVNYLLSIGLALWLLAAWVWHRQQPAPSAWARPAFVVAALLLYLVHLFGFGFYVLSLAVHELQRRESGALRLRLTTAATAVVGQLALPAFIHLVLYQRGSDLPAPVFGASLLDILSRKATLTGLLPMLLIHETSIWRAVMMIALALMLAGAVLRHRVQLHRFPLLLMPVLVLTFIVLPEHGFGSAMVDTRILLPLAFVLAAGTQIAGPVGWRQSELAAGLIYLALAGVVCTGKLLEWQPVSDVQRALRATMSSSIPAGSRLAVIDLRNATMPGSLPTAHAASWAVLDRQVMLSSLFARPFGPFAVGFRSDVAKDVRTLRTDIGVSRVEAPATLAAHFDYVAAFGRPADVTRYVAAAPVLIERDGVALMKLRP